MDVTDWLVSLGLARYASVFRDNDVNDQVLRRLTVDDLRELGVVSVGHRRLLLEAIAALAKGRHPSEQPTLLPRGFPGSDTERRQLTVMFCDIVDSTALSTALDPEDLQKVIGAYNQFAVQTVMRFGGHVARYIGDSVLAYFGYPTANEYDAERAVRAGLALIEGIPQIRTPETIRLRIGLATGVVVVGDVIDDGDVRLLDVVGDTPNLAARLQAIAEPNSVVIAGSTRSQVGALFDFADLGQLSLKGFAKPQQAWRVLRESGVLSRFEALRAERTPLVGRDEELHLLLRRWRQVTAGEGRMVMLSGEPGIGKSRMVSALFDVVALEPHAVLRYFCSPHYQESTLHPFIVQFERAIGLERDDSLETKVGKLQEFLTATQCDAGDASLLAELLRLPNSAAALKISPQRKREKLFAALLQLIEAVAQTRPTFLVFEDAHWIDPTSRELLDLVVERLPHIRVLLVLTSRPEFHHDWGGQAHVTVVTLNRLENREGQRLVTQISEGAGLSPLVVEEIVGRADGVPLFIEELTKAVLETNERTAQPSSATSASGSPGPSIPATLYASLAARFDNLGPEAKELAQVGAVIGREFSHELLEKVAQRSDLEAGLDRLVGAGLLFCRGAAPDSSYVFKHALVQDTAYSTLLRGRRQELHARVATVLETQFQDLVERHPEILAYHLTASNDTRRAVEQWLMAGKQAAARSAHLEAIRHFEHGLTALADLADGTIRDQLEIELQLARGPSLYATKGFAAPEAAQAYARARDLAEQRDDARQIFTAVNGLWQSANGAGQLRECLALSSRLQELATNTKDDALLLQAHHSAWATHLYSGEPSAALRHSLEGRQLFDPERHSLNHQLYGGHDPGSCAMYLGAQAHWLLGQADEGLALCKQGLSLAEKIAHPFSLACALQYSSMLRLDRGEPELALQELEAAEALVANQRLGFVLEPKLLRGAALTALGSHQEATMCVREGLTTRNGSTRLRSYGLVRLADVLSRQGDYESALLAVRDGLATVERTGHRQWQAELHRLEGIALFGLGRLDEGQGAIEQAMRIAHQQQAKVYELRAATTLAKFLGERGKRTAARKLLATVFGGFEQGFDTADLKEATTLLDQLA